MCKEMGVKGGGGGGDGKEMEMNDVIVVRRLHWR